MRLLLLSFCLLLLANAARAEQTDVLIYGATPGGIAAALAAAEDGEKVLLVERTDRIGGMFTNGLSHTDFRTFESITGAFLRMSQAVMDYYRPELGDKTSALTFAGMHAEPSANLAALEKLIAAQPLITVRKEWSLEATEASSEAVGDVAGEMRSLEVGLFADPKGEKHSVSARYFIDATYEGDLLAAAGVPYRVGREASSEFNESLAPKEPDSELQAYNFRLCMTRDPANRVAVRAPAGYNREDFTGLLPLIKEGTIKRPFGMTPDTIFKAQLPELPHAKIDINDMSMGPVRLSMPGHNDGWPDGGGGVAIRGGATSALEVPPFSRVGLARTRQAIFDEHVKWQIGLLYFVQNDEAVPEDFRKAANEWGWCRDEFRENAHLPDQLYVREARRMQGIAIYTENDSAPEPGDARSLLHRDSIAMGDYGPNCHGTSHDGSAFGDKHTGEFYKNVAPYQIPYGVLVPAKVDNLLVVCAISSSHVGFCTLRYEPIWASLGQAAGHAVHIARQDRVSLQNLSVAKLQTRVRQDKSATIYFSDIACDSPDFAAVQWWGTLGGFHGVEPALEKPGQRGEKIIGQYFQAFQGHAAKLDEPLTDALTTKWGNLARENGVPSFAVLAKDPAGKNTRSEWIRAAWLAAGKP